MVKFIKPLSLLKEYIINLLQATKICVNLKAALTLAHKEMSFLIF